MGGASLPPDAGSGRGWQREGSMSCPDAGDGGEERPNHSGLDTDLLPRALDGETQA